MSEKLKNPSANHRSRCQICKHPEREQIEEDFLHWIPAHEIAEDYKLGSYRTVYRHAHARGLLERRRSGWRLSLDQLIERGSRVVPTSGALVAALRLQFQLELREAAKQVAQPLLAVQKTQGTPATASTARGAKERKPQFIMTLDGWPRSDAVFPHPKPGDPPRRDLLLEEIERDHPEWLEGPVVRLLRPVEPGPPSAAQPEGCASPAPTHPVPPSGAGILARAPLPAEGDPRPAPLAPKDAVATEDVGMQATTTEKTATGETGTQAKPRTNDVTDKNCFAFPSPRPWDRPEYEPRPPKKYGPNDVIPRW